MTDPSSSRSDSTRSGMSRWVKVTLIILVVVVLLVLVMIALSSGGIGGHQIPEHGAIHDAVPTLATELFR